MRRRMLWLGALALGLLACTAPPAWAEPVRVTFLHSNDVYEIAPVNGAGGFAPFMTLLREERAANPNTITTFGGDLLSPSILSSLTKGAQMIELTNAIGVQVAVPGNHEFDFGPELAAQRFGQSDYPWLGTNILGPDGAPALGTVATRIMNIGGYGIGFLGLLTPAAATLASPGAAITLADPIETARRAVAQLREEGAALVVALTHQDIAQDRRLAGAVPGIDLILGGHDHQPITFYEHGTLIVKAGTNLRYLAAVDIVLDRVVRDEKEVIVHYPPQWRYVSTAEVEPDSGIRNIVAGWQTRLDSELGQVIGNTEVELDSREAAVRGGEAVIGNLFADALRAATGADAAIINGGGIRGNTTYSAGAQLTRKDILAELPFGNTVVVIELKGSDIVAALENGVSQVAELGGRFPQVSGLSFSYDPARPPGERIVTVDVQGRPLDPEATYRIATNDFMAGGGDGYAALTNGQPVIDAAAGRLMTTTVIDHIAAAGTVAPEIEGRIRVVH